MEEKNLGKCSIGLEPNLAALLSYSLGFITGIIFFVVEKENKFVRFHAMQSIITFGAIFVLKMAVSVVFFMPYSMMMTGTLPVIVGIFSLILWVILMIKAFQGETFKLSIIGDIAEKQVK